MLLFLLFINIFSLNWKISEFSGDITIIDSNVSSSLTKDSIVKESSIIYLKQGANLKLSSDEDNFILNALNESMFAFSAYKNYSAHIYLIKGELGIINNSGDKVFTIETSTMNFISHLKSSFKLSVQEYGSAYKVTATISAGTVTAYNINGKKLAQMILGDSFLFWKGRFIETLSKGKKEELKKVEKKENKKTLKTLEKEKIKNPSPAAEKPKAFTVSDVEKELFGKIQSNDEFKKVLLSEFKDKAIEESICEKCKNAKIEFRVPKSINLVSTNIFPDKNLPAVFYKTQNSKFQNEIFSNYRVISEGGSDLIYLVPSGTYYVRILNGVPFKLSVQSAKTYIINVSAFINPYNEIEVICEEEAYLSIKGREAPFFIFPGTYDFYIKNELTNVTKNKKIEIKAGAVIFVEL